jgi:hypothetical protein
MINYIVSWVLDCGMDDRPSCSSIYSFSGPKIMSAQFDSRWLSASAQIRRKLGRISIIFGSFITCLAVSFFRCKPERKVAYLDSHAPAHSLRT